MAAALLSCAIMRALEREDYENQLKKQRKENAQKMEQIACSLLEEYNRERQNSEFPQGEAHDALLHEVPGFGGRNCLDLASSAKGIQFAKQPAFQTLTDKIWYGGIEGPCRKLLYILLCLPLFTIHIFIWPLEIFDLDDYLSKLVSLL